MKNIKTVTYDVTAQIHRVCINKQLKFNSSVVWRRSNNKIKTRQVPHQKGYSVFNEQITLPLNMQYNQDTELYEEKNTEFNIQIHFNGQMKSGGVAKFDASSIFNKDQEGIKKKIPVSKCPDPNAFIQITFTYRKSQNPDQNMSVMNTSTQELSLSRIQFNDDKSSLELQRMNETISKLTNLADEITKKNKTKKKQDTGKNDQLKQKLQKLQSQKQTLTTRILNMESDALKKNSQIKDLKQKTKKEIDSLKDKLSRKQEELKVNKTMEDSQNQYKELYYKTKKELQDIKDCKQSQSRTGSLEFRASGFDDVHQVANFSNDFAFENNQRQTQDQKTKIQELSKQNIQLQSQIATMSYKMAQIFNASYEIGGAKLLDHLQTAIGLIQ